LFFSNANVEVHIESCNLVGYDVFLIGNLFLHFRRACCHHLHGIRRSNVIQNYTSDTQLVSEAKNLWMICNVENSYPFPTQIMLFADNFYQLFSFITEVNGVGIVNCLI
jgi:hypothetical protein